jgi:hypothetical protein
MQFSGIYKNNLKISSFIPAFDKNVQKIICDFDTIIQMTEGYKNEEECLCKYVLYVCYVFNHPTTAFNIKDHTCYIQYLSYLRLHCLNTEAHNLCASGHDLDKILNITICILINKCIHVANEQETYSTCNGEAQVKYILSVIYSEFLKIYRKNNKKCSDLLQIDVFDICNTNMLMMMDEDEKVLYENTICINNTRLFNKVYFILKLYKSTEQMLYLNDGYIKTELKNALEKYRDWNDVLLDGCVSCYYKPDIKNDLQSENDYMEYIRTFYNCVLIFTCEKHVICNKCANDFFIHNENYCCPCCRAPTKIAPCSGKHTKKEYQYSFK